MKTAVEVVKEGIEYLAGSGLSEPELNSQWLLASVLGLKRLEIIAGPDLPVEKSRISVYRKLLKQRAGNVPLSYVTGFHDFMGIELEVCPGVFIPRPETEELVEKILQFIGKKSVRILDFGTGSGCIAVALASALFSCKITAVDSSAKALAVAKKNALKHNLSKKMIFLKAGSVKDVPGTFHLIVSNPPYIPVCVIKGLDAEVRAEPRKAIDGGKDGLKWIKRIVMEAPLKLRPAGALFMEIGADQKQKIEPLFSGKPWRKVEFIKDYNNRYRFVKGQVTAVVSE
ncbi:MAG: peptide chain release factor N(5)-glutamine methyltransferase [Elusimicrobia bacterium]|nr:peptide chain release factor N(5)-glutamine methyltransferase [Elusimicrobiota bacterium]